MPDIDIDFADRNVVLNKLKHRVAKLDTGKKHNTGVYFTEVPHNPLDNVSTLDYKQAEDRGYFKVDFLNVSIYEKVKNEKHLIEYHKIGSHTINHFNLSKLSYENQKKEIEDFDKAAEDLRLATRHLGMIVGKVDVEEILGSIFNDFCIGK